MQSKINENAEVTKDQWVISLVRIRNHAIIVVESIGFDGPDENFRMQWFDFVSKRKPTHHNHCVTNCTVLFGGVKNKIIEGEVRICHKHQSPWSTDTDSWLCEPTKARLMIEDIEKDRQTPPKFQYKGGPDGVNCTTWTWKKLEIAGIDASNKTKHNLIAVRAKHNIGSKRHYVA